MGKADVVFTGSLGLCTNLGNGGQSDSGQQPVHREPDTSLHRSHLGGNWEGKQNVINKSHL